MSNRGFILLIAAILITASLIHSIQSNEIERLKKDHRHLKTKFHEMTAAAKDLEALKEIRFDPEQLKTRQEHHRELMKVRAQVARLREQTQTASQTLRENIERLTLAQKAELEAIDRIQAERDTRKWAKDTRRLIRSYLNVIDRISKDTFPSSRSEFEERLQHHSDQGQLRAYWESIAREAQEKGYPLDATFEFVPTEFSIERSSPERLILRERTPRQLPDGNWGRYYGTTRMNSGQLTSSSPDFTEAERPSPNADGDLEFSFR